jgi:integrase
MKSALDPQTETQPQSRRGRGEGRIWRIGRIWWVQYYVHGRQIRESSRSDRKPVAERLLRRRLGEAAAGIVAFPQSARVTYGQIRDALLADYAANGRKWLRQGKDGPYLCGVPELDRSFEGCRAVAITTDAIRAFTQKRQADGAANGTINRSIALLRRMFRLAVQDGKLRDVPHFPMLKEAPPRKGFLECNDFQKLREELPEYLRSIATMGYYTGMRLGEILGLRWKNVNFLDAEVRLDAGSTKNDEPRTIPLTGELLEMLTMERQKSPEAEFVFMHNGEKIQSFRKAWDSACQRASLNGLLFHDLRRTGVRNLVRAGVPERVAMAISGHKTRAVFERCNIVSGRDLKDATRKLETYLAVQNGARTGQIASLRVRDLKRRSVVMN